MENFRRIISEVEHRERRLGRHVNHDPRSLNYLIKPDGTVATKIWKRHTPILNQGNLGSCTGNASVGVLGTDPFWHSLAQKINAGFKLNEAEAVRVYSAATQIDGFPGAYPPQDTGSDGLSVAKALLAARYISGYQHITSIAAAQTAIQSSPFIIGSNWYTGMDNPDASGVVTATGGIRGGHEYECHGYDAAADLWLLCNSWGSHWGVKGHFTYTSQTFATLLSQQGDATVFVPLATP